MRNMFRVCIRLLSGNNTASNSSVQKLTFYGRCYKKSPTFTSAVTGCILFALGDIARQQIVEKKGIAHEYSETMRMGTLGLIWVGPVINTWYMILEKSIKISGVRGVLIKIACDQLLFAPILILTIVNFLKKSTNYQEFKQVMSTEYLTVLKTNYLFWPLIQFITFSFIPLSLRVVWVNSISIVWNTFISWVMYGKKQ
ncbi:hypothetical protein LOD99_12708 [Oopsacas minuta]|uniref:Mitochondrial inner membrane protein Mpv17 n=1 Tax=Oopsacas minuta TaxID=111878 RepID=A0AAV7JCU6_9METZ|nr:hypothetical protein LOD99_12708 [Oopsacas minuta]